MQLLDREASTGNAKGQVHRVRYISKKRVQSKWLSNMEKAVVILEGGVLVIF